MRAWIATLTTGNLCEVARHVWAECDRAGAIYDDLPEMVLAAAGGLIPKDPLGRTGALGGRRDRERLMAE
jgi:hypothetical protein